jgi:hypothetical protein
LKSVFENGRALRIVHATPWRNLSCQRQAVNRE